MNPFKILSDLANKLDKLGLYREADLLDTIVKEAAGHVAKNNLIKALKSIDDDATAKAIEALTNLIHNTPSHSTPAKELGLTEDKFKELTKALNPQSINIQFEKAQEIMGIGAPTPEPSSRTHNPITGRPWSSGPAPKTNSQLHKELLHLKAIIDPQRGKAAGRYHVSILPPEDYIGIDAGLSFKPDDLVKGLEQAGYKKYIPDGATASRSKMIGKDRIVVDVDISGTAIPTDISVSPMTQENYDTIAGIFGGIKTMIALPSGAGKSKELTFDEAKEQFEDYMNQPDPDDLGRP